ncbi:hypothetical protein [uncultured Pontibacter sp.]|uniref:WD40/YVTN/BNR-like repeat-containing protein n=1 Tax=uncultured Pontibacter sp. TaxID=453356 RepID=UPI00261B203C|nr:hypothetical protein [uncultured Pontibacter sp.]
MNKTKLLIPILLLLGATSSYAQKVLSGALPTHQEVIESLKSSYKLNEYDQPSVSVVFNRDTIVVAGYLADPELSAIKSTVYRTLNGGKSWEIRSFNGDAWIYDAYHKPDGLLWMGGSDGHVYYSSNYGLAWSKRPKPFEPAGRVLSIYMVDHRYGVAGSLHNGLAVTNNNWATTEQLPTPLDQGRYTILANSARDRVNRVQILGPTIIINQDDHIFFSGIDSIHWKSFRVPVIDFYADTEKVEWHLKSLGSKVFVLSENLSLKRSYVDSTLMEPYKETKNSSILLGSFLTAGIKTVMVKAIVYEAEGGKGLHTIYRERTQEARFKKVDTAFVFSSKGYGRRYAREYRFSENELARLLNSLNSISNGTPSTAKIRFSERDFTDYERLIASKREERENNKVWGGDFSYLLDLNNRQFDEYREVVKTIVPEHLERVYRDYDYDWSGFQEEKPALSMTVINNTGDTLSLHSAKAKHFGLPWTLQVGGQTAEIYDADISHFLRQILPSSFINYEKLLGGELIFELIRERIIDGLEYENNPPE